MHSPIPVHIWGVHQISCDQVSQQQQQQQQQLLQQFPVQLQQQAQQQGLGSYSSLPLQRPPISLPLGAQGLAHRASALQACQCAL